jgi:hypothetical protein
MLPLLASAGPVLTLSPATGAVNGPPSALVGWGFTLFNPDPNFVVVSAAEFCTTTVVAGFTVCDLHPSPSLGVFTDYIGQFNFIVAGPAPESPTRSQVFSATLHTGIGSFAINPAAVPVVSFSGRILLHYDLYSRSPNDLNFNPDTDAISFDNTLTANASVAAVPEPSTFLLMCAGAAAFLRRRLTLWGAR